MPALPTLRGLRRPPSAAEAKRLERHWDGSDSPGGIYLDPPPVEWLRFAIKVREQKEITPDYVGQTRPECAAFLSGMVALGWDVYIGGEGRFRPGRAIRMFLRRSQWAGGGGMLLPLERAAFFLHDEVLDFHGELDEYVRRQRRPPRTLPKHRSWAWYAQPIDWFTVLHKLAHIAMIERERLAGRDPRALPECVGLEVDCAAWEVKLAMAVWGPLNVRVRALVAIVHDNHDRHRLRAAWDRVPGPEAGLIRAVRRAYDRAVAGSWFAERSRSMC